MSRMNNCAARQNIRGCLPLTRVHSLNVLSTSRAHPSLRIWGAQATRGTPAGLPFTRTAGPVHSTSSSAAVLTDASDAAQLPSTSPSNPAADAGSPAVSQATDAAAFNWFKAWYPVDLVSQLDKERPQAVTLLGQPLVIWWDVNSSSWVVQADRCPHRLAPLSEGRLTGTGTLMCSYHGWEFTSTGSCTSIPQLGDPSAAATATHSRRSCVATHPSKVAGGILWVWADASPSAAEDSSAVEPALGNYVGQKGWTLLGGDWFKRDVLYSFDALMENLFDPSHIPFAHHKIMGQATRDKAIPLNITTLVDVNTKGGFRLTRDSAPFRTPTPSTSVNDFVPPALCSSVQTTPSGRSIVLQFYGIPTLPGRARLIAGFLTNAKVPAAAGALSRLLEPIFHCGQNQILDSDGMILHVQERLLHQAQAQQEQQRAQQQLPPPAPGSAWRTAFYMPASADTGISKFRTWYEQQAGGSIPWPAGVGRDPGPVLPREVVLDRYTQHVAGCKSCSKALRWTQRLQVICLGASVVAAAVSAAQLVWQLQVNAAAAGAAAAVSTQAATGAAALLDPALWPAAAAAVAAVLLLLAYQGLKRLASRFLFVDYIHADK